MEISKFISNSDFCNTKNNKYVTLKVCKLVYYTYKTH